MADARQSSSMGLIIREKEPTNLETPFDQVDSYLTPVQQYAWRRWTFDWLTPNKPGRYALLARAKDANVGVQPEGHDPNYGTYVIDHPLPIDVFVDDSASSHRSFASSGA